MKVNSSVLRGRPEQIGRVLQATTYPVLGLMAVAIDPITNEVSIHWAAPGMPMDENTNIVQVEVGPAPFGWSWACNAPLTDMFTELDSLDGQPANMVVVIEDMGLTQDASMTLYEAMQNGFGRDGKVRGSKTIRDIILPSPSGEHDRLACFFGGRHYVLPLPGRQARQTLTAGWLPSANGLIHPLIVVGRRGDTVLYGNDPRGIWSNAHLPRADHWETLLTLPAPLAWIGRINRVGAMPIHLMDDRVLMVEPRPGARIEVVAESKFPSDFVARRSGRDEDDGTFSGYFGLTAAVLDQYGRPTCGFVRPGHEQHDHSAPTGTVMYSFLPLDEVDPLITGIPR